MTKIILSLYFVFFNFYAYSSSLSEIQEWKLKNETIKARIVHLTLEQNVYYAEADNIIKTAPLNNFSADAIEKIKTLYSEDKRPSGEIKPIPLKSFRPNKIPTTWPPMPPKGWQLSNWETSRNSLHGANPNDYDSKNEETLQFNMSAALWWHDNFTFRHTKIKTNKKLIKTLLRKFKIVSKASSSDFIPEGNKASLIVQNYSQIMPSELDQYIGGNCITGIFVEPVYKSRGYRHDFYLIKKTKIKGTYSIYYWGEKITGKFKKLNTKEKDGVVYEFTPDDPTTLPEWMVDQKVKLRYHLKRSAVRTMIPIEKQLPGVTWKAHPVAHKIVEAKQPKPIGESIVLPDNEINFLDIQRPLTMAISSVKGKSTTATLNKVSEGHVSITRRHKKHSLPIESLDFNTQMKVKFWKANQGKKLKLPACRLHYKVLNKKRGSRYTFTICYDGESKCYLNTQNYNTEVYFNSENLTYSVYKSEKGRLLLVAKHPYATEHKLAYPKQKQLSINRKNYPSTSASHTHGFANRTILSKSNSFQNYRDIAVLKAAHVEAQPVVQFIHGFSNIQVPATQTISRSNFSLTSSMRLLYENATLPTELHWKQARHSYSAKKGNVRTSENMELTLEKISPLEDNFFHQFELLEAAEEEAKAKRKAANAE